MQRYVLLDRDGVINRDLPGSVLHRRDFELLPGVGEAIAQINRKGYGVLVLTNQACVGRGELSRPELDEIHDLMRRLIAEKGGRIADIFVCPHVDTDRLRLPEAPTGPRATRASPIQFRPTGNVDGGRRRRDIEAASNAHCWPALVRTGKGAATTVSATVPVFTDLAHFARDLPHATDLK